jgi:hypothetical protein
MNYKEVEHDNKQYVFVTRTDGKPISKEEIEEFLNKDKPDQGFIPNTKQRRQMFQWDLKEGMAHCVKKYGKTKEEITVEAKRLWPNHRMIK